MSPNVENNDELHLPGGKVEKVVISFGCGSQPNSASPKKRIMSRIPEGFSTNANFNLSGMQQSQGSQPSTNHNYY